jgi:hypothetical protein
MPEPCVSVRSSHSLIIAYSLVFGEKRWSFGEATHEVVASLTHFLRVAGRLERYLARGREERLGGSV